MRKYNFLSRLGGRPREPGAAQRAMRLTMVGLLVLPQAVAPAVITVTGTDSTIAVDGVCSLREAINNANAGGDTSGGDCVAGDAGADTVVLTATVTLTEVDNSSCCDARGLPVISTDVTIQGNSFTIARDSMAPEFGIFLVRSGTLRLVDTTVSGGDGGDGAGIYNSGTTTLTNSTVSDNVSSRGGGGIKNDNSLTLTNSTVSGNYAGFDGGGIDTYSATTTLINSTVSGNSTNGDGGGIYSGFGGSTTLTNSTVSGNSANGSGGGIARANYGTTTLINSTVVRQLGVRRRRHLQQLLFHHREPDQQHGFRQHRQRRQRRRHLH